MWWWARLLELSRDKIWRWIKPRRRLPLPATEVEDAGAVVEEVRGGKKPVEDGVDCVNI